MNNLYYRYFLFTIFLAFTSGEFHDTRIVQSFYNQTCVFLNYKCNGTESGLLMLKALSLDCLPLNHESSKNCSKMQLVAYQDIDCKQNLSLMKFTANESFQDCGNSTAGETPSINSSMGMRHNCSFVVPEEGLYMIEMTFNNTPLAKGESLDMSWRSTYGHLPPAFWPLLIFYQVSLSLYTFYFVVWIVLCCYFYKELLQLQYYIAFIILLGVVEKLIYLVEFERFNRTAEEAAFGAVIFGELVSALKRAAARILVIVVSVGFGIVKPRLGRTLYFLGGAGLLYFIFSASQGIHYRENRSIQKKNVTAFLALILALIDSIFFYWIFHSLIRTMRTLRLRKNTTKLAVYKSFTYTLIFALIASLLFIIWSFSTFQLGDCIKNWRELWLDDVFWPSLFSLLLLMIMILWRPSANNLRYAYSALNDDEEEEESREPMMNAELEGIKLRNRPECETSNQQDQNDPLKWVEENIPNMVMSSALLANDELEETLFEINKLQ